MRAVDVITKKVDGLELSRDELKFFIQGFTDGEIPDYQASAWAMAVLFQGMTPQEMADLTEAMVESGEQLDLSGCVDIAVDKHSTGGVGDKTTLVVLPVVAACGVPVGKTSGKGLSYTGGTLDKMQSFPGYRIDLSAEEFISQLRKEGLVLSGQTENLAAADGKLYALRDVTGTVPSIPLIASSVMSKKIASGADAIVLDVKVGVGTFMKTEDEATELAKAMVDIGTSVGRRVVALISEMNQPLGFAVGNALEVREAIETLNGEGPQDFRDHCIEVAGHMLVLGGAASNLDEAKSQAGTSLNDATALEKFRRLVLAQNGDDSIIDDPSLLPQAKVIQEVSSPRDGYITQVHARMIGIAAMQLGAGREKKGDPIDHSVGIVVRRKVGDYVHKGDSLFTVHARDKVSASAAVEEVLAAHSFSDEPVDPLPLFYRTIHG
ncbi:MAG: pyrimidine-nucleoside phosphorylase [Anaerolineales bacterium]|nr:pyrimidine-nucleoside phosphorylase [Anaerolineales bacterium]